MPRTPGCRLGWVRSIALKSPDCRGERVKFGRVLFLCMGGKTNKLRYSVLQRLTRKLKYSKVLAPGRVMQYGNACYSPLTPDGIKALKRFRPGTPFLLHCLNEQGFPEVRLCIKERGEGRLLFRFAFRYLGWSGGKWERSELGTYDLGTLVEKLGPSGVRLYRAKVRAGDGRWVTWLKGLAE